jgi:hypothetical protein
LIADTGIETLVVADKMVRGDAYDLFRYSTDACGDFVNFCQASVLSFAIEKDTLLEGFNNV